MTFFFWKDPAYLRIKPYFHGWIRPYRSHIIGGILLGFVASAMTSGVPLVLRELIDKIFTEKNTHYLFILPFAFFLLFALKGLAVFFQNYLLRIAALRMVNDVRKSLFGHLLSLPLGYFGHEGTGSLMGRVTYDAERLQGGVANTFRDLIQQGFTIIGVLVSMFVMSPKLTLFLLVTLPTVLIPIRKTGKKLKTLSRRTQESFGDVNQHLSETLSSIRLIKGVVSEERERENFKKYSDEFVGFQIKTAKYSNLLSPIMETLGALAAGLAVWIGGYAVIHGTLSFGTLVGFIAAAQMLYQPIKGFAGAQTDIQQSLAAAERMVDILAVPEERVHESEKRSVSTLEREIRFQEISFSYPGATKEALSEISLSVPAGSFVALVGASGSGKSTLANLLPKFYRPTKGEIFWDGIPLSEIDSSSLRKIIGFVTQDVILMNQTVRDNLLYGLERAVPEEELVAAARAAYAHDFISALPNGYDTRVGERGIFLSGGEKQRLALARVVLRNPALLILDEATSALDSESEWMVQKALDSIMRGRTTIAIAHRLTTIRQASVVHVMEGGRLIESGTHEELMKTDSRYRTFILHLMRTGDVVPEEIV
ncbi:MAG: ABC transporter ATP-binding protein [Nitrospiraceae bacterium]|nr:ABC transporter ATP-binding protein [Nitrospiraceae bacterium]